MVRLICRSSTLIYPVIIERSSSPIYPVIIWRSSTLIYPAIIERSSSPIYPVVIERSSIPIYPVITITMLPKFEGEAALKDSTFWWVVYLTHKVSWSVYSLRTNLIGLALYMIWYIQYSWWLVVEWSRTKYWNRWRTWWGLCWRGFHLARVKFDRYGE